MELLMVGTLRVLIVFTSFFHKHNCLSKFFFEINFMFKSNL